MRLVGKGKRKLKNFSIAYIGWSLPSQLELTPSTGERGKSGQFPSVGLKFRCCWKGCSHSSLNDGSWLRCCQLVSLGILLWGDGQAVYRELQSLRLWAKPRETVHRVVWGWWHPLQSCSWSRGMLLAKRCHWLPGNSGTGHPQSSGWCRQPASKAHPNQEEKHLPLLVSL